MYIKFLSYQYIGKQRLHAVIMKFVDISYGGENGFTQAIQLSSECLANVKFMQEKKLIGLFFFFANNFSIFFL